jgi:transcription elongation factor Elf1
MKFDDPLSVTCPGCGKSGFYRVKALLTLEAKCIVCGHSLAAAGEDVHRLLKKVDNFSIAMRLVSEIEELDDRIKFDDEEFEEVSCLNGIIDVTERRFAAASRANPRDGAVDIVQRAVERVFPDCSEPDGSIPLADAFPEGTRGRMWTRL